MLHSVVTHFVKQYPSLWHPALSCVGGGQPLWSFPATRVHDSSCLFTIFKYFNSFGLYNHLVRQAGKCRYPYFTDEEIRNQNSGHLPKITANKMQSQFLNSGLPFLSSPYGFLADAFPCSGLSRAVCLHLSWTGDGGRLCVSSFLRLIPFPCPPQPPTCTHTLIYFLSPSVV